MSAVPHLPKSFTARLTLTSDWHCGLGAGRPGNVDRLVRRDADGLPFVPAKILTGMWRDAAEAVALGLDDGKADRPWSAWVDYLFGDQPALERGPKPERPRPAALSIRPARLAPKLREHFLGQSANARALREALTFVQPGVKIDADTGRATDEHLRFIEMARTGAVLEAECTRPDDMPTEAIALLLAATRLVQRIGGKRRRGAGRCTLAVDEGDIEAAVTWLTENYPSPGEPLPPSSRTMVAASAKAASGGWLRVPLTLTPLGPLGISDRKVGNVWSSLDFIPGTFLLAHVTRALGDAVRPAIAAGDLRVLPATRDVAGQRGRPVPFVLYTPKGVERPDNPSEVLNRFTEPEPKDAPIKQSRAGYVSRSDGNVWPACRKVSKSVLTHNTIDDPVQRPTTDVGGVYSYEAIAPLERGQPLVFHTELRLRASVAEALGDDWWAKLDGDVRLGRAKKDDYGQARLTAGPAEAWDPPAPEVKGNQLTVWLLSDTLVRDERLRPAPTAEALRRELATRLGIDETTLTVIHDDTRLSALVRVRRIESWNAAWALPRPTLAALQAGSCIAFQSKGPLDPDKLQEIAAAGLGERRAEGYGEVAFNDPLVTTAPKQFAPWPPEPPPDRHPKPAPPPIRSNDPAVEFARVIEAAAWRTRLRREAVRVAHDQDGELRRQVFGWTATKPPMSQLGGLRALLRPLRAVGDRQVLDWIERLDDNPRRSSKWPGNSLSLIRNLIQSEGQVWKDLACQDWPLLTAGADKQLKSELWAEAVRTLFDECFRAYARDVEPAAAATVKEG